MKDAIRTKSNIQPCNAFTCLFTPFFGSVSINTHLTDHFDHYNHHPVTLTRTSLGSTDVAARSSSRNFKKIEVSRWWESVSVSKYPLTAPNNVNKPVWVGVRSKMSTNDLLMDSFSMKRSQNGSLVSSSCTDFTTLLPQQHHDTPKFDDVQWHDASIALNVTHNNTNFPTTLLWSRTVSTFPYIFLQPNWTLCSSERTEPTLVWWTCLHSTQSTTIGSREWFISGRMLTSKEESVGSFKVAHGDLLEVVSVMGRN